MTAMTRDEFTAAAARSGLKLDAASADEIHQAFGFLEVMIARVNQAKPREAEPALIFVPEQR
jgi:hypothetical protein